MQFVKATYFLWVCGLKEDLVIGPTLLQGNQFLEQVSPSNLGFGLMLEAVCLVGYLNIILIPRVNVLPFLGLGLKIAVG